MHYLGCFFQWMLEGQASHPSPQTVSCADWFRWYLWQAIRRRSQCRHNPQLCTLGGGWHCVWNIVRTDWGTCLARNLKDESLLSLFLFWRVHVIWYILVLCWSKDGCLWHPIVSYTQIPLCRQSQVVDKTLESELIITEPQFFQDSPMQIWHRWLWRSLLHIFPFLLAKMSWSWVVFWRPSLLPLWLASMLTHLFATRQRNSIKCIACIFSYFFPIFLALQISPLKHTLTGWTWSSLAFAGILRQHHLICTLWCVLLYIHQACSMGWLWLVGLAIRPGKSRSWLDDWSTVACDELHWWLWCDATRLHWSIDQWIWHLFS